MLQNAGTDRKGKQAGAGGSFGRKDHETVPLTETGDRGEKALCVKTESNPEGKGSGGEQAKGVCF